jgi:uncharacterized protein YkwD
MKTILIIILALFCTTAFCQEYHLSYDSAMIVLFNKERSKRLLPKLDYDHSRQAALDDKARRMSRKNGFQHDSGGFAGEIIQLTYHASPDQAIKRWMDSPGHRAIILSRWDKYKSVCAGSYFAKNGSCYLVIRTYKKRI